MEEKNNSKQVLLSIVGIAVLVIAIVGVSFAFFSYTRQGTSNNVITTGQISLAFEEEEAINLTNQFPTLDADAVIPGSSNNEVSELDFSVTGYYSAATGGINYTIYAIDGEAGTPPYVNRFQDSEINVKLIPQSSTTLLTNVSGPTATGQTNPGPKAVSTLTSDANGKILATGRIQPGTTSGAGAQTDTFKLYMYVNDTVRISDTDTTVTFTGAHTASSAVKYCASDLHTKNKTITVPPAQEGDDPTETTIQVYDYGCRIYTDNSALTTITDDQDLTNFDTTKLLKVYSTMYYSLKLKVIGSEVTQ